MAKVRIQARTSERDTEEENGLPHSSRPPAKAKKGAVGLLIRVLETEGFVGWYQVVQDQPRVCQTVSLMFLSIGNVGTDYQSGALASIVVRIQGAVRTMGFDPDGPVVQVKGYFVTRWAYGPGLIRHGWQRPSTD